MTGRLPPVRRARRAKAAGALLLLLASLTIPSGTTLHAVGPSYPGEPTFDPRERALPLAALGWMAQWQILAAIAALTVAGSAATLILLRLLQARQRRQALGQDALELLARHAERLERLYRRNAGLFTEQAEFWSLLAADEAKHARWARETFARVAAGEVLFQVDLFPSAEIGASCRDLDAQLDPALPKTDPVQAFREASAVEGVRSRWQLPDFFSGPEKSVLGMALFHAEILAHCERLEELKKRAPTRGGES